MVEVFKTNVNDLSQARMVIRMIEAMFPSYKVTFDLDDCDRILRVQCKKGNVRSGQLVHLLEEIGFHAEVLQEEDPFLKDIV